MTHPLLPAFAVLLTFVATAHAEAPCDQNYSCEAERKWAIKQLHDAEDTNNAASVKAAQEALIRADKATLDAILNGNDIDPDREWYHDNR